MAENVNWLAASIADTKILYGKKIESAQDFLDYAQRNSMNLKLWDEGFDGIADGNHVTDQRMFAEGTTLFMQLDDNHIISFDLASDKYEDNISEKTIQDNYTKRHGLSSLSDNAIIAKIGKGKIDIQVNLNNVDLNSEMATDAGNNIVEAVLQQISNSDSAEDPLTVAKSIFGNDTENLSISKDANGVITMQVVNNGRAYTCKYDTNSKKVSSKLTELTIDTLTDAEGKINGVDKKYFKQPSNFRIVNGAFTYNMDIDPAKIDLSKTDDVAGIVQYEVNKGKSAENIRTLLGNDNAIATSDASDNYTVKIVNPDKTGYVVTYKKNDTNSPATHAMSLADLPTESLNGISLDSIDSASNFQIVDGKLTADLKVKNQTAENLTNQTNTANIIAYEADKGMSAADMQKLLRNDNTNSNALVLKDPTSGNYTAQVISASGSYVVNYNPNTPNIRPVIHNMSVTDLPEESLNGLSLDSIASAENYRIENGKLAADLKVKNQSVTDLDNQNKIAGIVKYEAGKGMSAADLRALLGNNNALVTKDNAGNYTVQIVKADGTGYTVRYTANNKTTSTNPITLADLPAESKQISGIPESWVSSTGKLKITDNKLTTDLTIKTLSQTDLDAVTDPTTFKNLIKYAISNVPAGQNAEQYLRNIFGNSAVPAVTAGNPIQVNFTCNGTPYNVSIANNNTEINIGNATTGISSSNLTSPNVTISATDFRQLRTNISAATTDAAKKNVLAKFLLTHFGGMTDAAAENFNISTYSTSSYWGNSSNPTSSTTAPFLTAIGTTVRGLTGITGWNNNTDKSSANFNLLLTQVLSKINNSNNFSNSDGISICSDATFNMSDVRNSFYLDPIGFEANGKKFDFVEDENKNGIFDGPSEFVGADTGWADFTKYDKNNNGIIEGDELNDLNVLVQNEQTGEHEITSAKKAGIFKIDLTSFQRKDSINEYGNILAGEFKLIFNDKEITGSQTYDTEAYLNKHYKDEEGLCFCA